MAIQPDNIDDRKLHELYEFGESNERGVVAGPKFPTIDIHPDTPVTKLAKALAMQGLSIYHNPKTGRLTIGESWRMELERRGPPPPDTAMDRARDSLLARGID